MKEAAARIKINKLLEATGWRFFADVKGPANIQLEPSVTLKAQDLDALGENFEKATKGFIDFLLLNEKGFPFIVIEAKAENKNPLVGKEQARKYAKSQNCRFVILSNGNLHYFWDLQRGNPYVITAFPSPTSVTGYQKTTPDPKRLIEEPVGDDYVVLTQRPGYASEAAWKNPGERSRFIEVNGLRFLRLYQKKAIYAIQQAIARGLDRFLLEMAILDPACGTAGFLISAYKHILRANTKTLARSSTTLAPSDGERDGERGYSTLTPDEKGRLAKNFKGYDISPDMVRLPEQHRIVAKVDELMALCDRLEAQLTTTQTQSRRLLESTLHHALAQVASGPTTPCYQHG